MFRTEAAYLSRLVSVLLLGAGLVGHEAPTARDHVFSDTSLLDLTLTADLGVVLKDVGEEREYHTATIAYTVGGETTVEVPLKIRTRGHYRRNPDNCDFPPLFLNFQKDTSHETLFELQDRIKLVTHCRTGVPIYEQYVLQEYLVYRAFGLITDRSFRVRLVRLTYRDSGGTHPDLTQFGFLIEDEDVMADRYHGQIIEDIAAEEKSINREHATLTYVFQYMVANIDWSMKMQHNIKLVGQDTNGPFTAVPYDFDHAMVIGPHYADHLPPLGPTTLRHQLFREFCRSQDEVADALNRFREQREQLYALYEDLEFLAPDQRTRILRHYDRFFRLAEDPQRVHRVFVKPCRVKP